MFLCLLLPVLVLLGFFFNLLIFMSLSFYCKLSALFFFSVLLSVLLWFPLFCPLRKRYRKRPFLKSPEVLFATGKWKV